MLQMLTGAKDPALAERLTDASISFAAALAAAKPSALIATEKAVTRANELRVEVAARLHAEREAENERRPRRIHPSAAEIKLDQEFKKADADVTRALGDLAKEREALAQNFAGVVGRHLPLAMMREALEAAEIVADIFDQVNAFAHRNALGLSVPRHAPGTLAIKDLRRLVDSFA